MSTQTLIVRVSPLVEEKLVAPLDTGRRLAHGIWLLPEVPEEAAVRQKLDVMADDLLLVQGVLGFPVPLPSDALARKLSELLTGPAMLVALSRGLRPVAAALRAELPWPEPVMGTDGRGLENVCVLGHGEVWSCRRGRPWESDPLNVRTVRQLRSARISRAEVKWQQARACLRWLVDDWPQGPWLDLGAAPGGITRLLAAEFHDVTALDLGELDAEVAELPGVLAITADATVWSPSDATRFAGLVCDMNGLPKTALSAVVRAANWLLGGAPLMLTLKARSWTEINELAEDAEGVLRPAGVEVLRHQRFVSHRKHETALLCRKRCAL